MIAALMFAAALSGSNPAVVHSTQTDAQWAEWVAFDRIIESMRRDMQNAVYAVDPAADGRIQRDLLKTRMDAIESSYTAQVDAFGTKMVAMIGRESGNGDLTVSLLVETIIPQIKACIPVVRAEVERRGDRIMSGQGLREGCGSIQAD
ncbi:hypothetical protein [Brevundimonas sp.]|uniref:hypothetical protein n=1 Tax=Brevundimonas sp. TaxID=1871086 RepID=UPI00260F0110|nr:hypothetical protein [Brevundimonas sp.]